MHCRCQSLLLKLCIETPYLLLRPYLLDLQSEDVQKKAEGMVKLQALLSLRVYHPAAFAHAFFNQLLGFLKSTQEGVNPHGLYAQATILPMLCDLIFSVNGLKYSDFKKERFDTIVATNGSFWFMNKKKAAGGLHLSRELGDGPLINLFSLSFFPLLSFFSQTAPTSTPRKCFPGKRTVPSIPHQSLRPFRMSMPHSPRYFASTW